MIASSFAPLSQDCFGYLGSSTVPYKLLEFLGNKLVVIRERRGLGAVKIGEGDEEVQTSGYKNK